MTNKCALKMKALMSLGDSSIVQIDGCTATKAMRAGWKLGIDVKFPPDMWELSSKDKTLDWKKDMGVPADIKEICEDLEKKYNEACATIALDGVEEPTPEEPPEKVPEEVDKLAELDKIMDGEKEVPNKPEPKHHKSSNVPAVIPDNIRSKQIATLTRDDIKNYLCPTATDQEAYLFLQLCQARNLNPFLNEAYLIKFGNKATMVVGKEAYMRRAEAHPSFDGFEAGIIIRTESGEVERREGTFILKGEILLGGWAKVYRKDRKQPFISEVSLDEYNSKQSLWLTKPATMIRKVAIVQAKREAFPSEFSGMYDASEMDGEVMEAVYEVKP